MLVLTRKSSQAIIIADAIEITVLGIVGDKVRLGILAPRDVPVYRKEVYLELHPQPEATLPLPPAADEN